VSSVLGELEAGGTSVVLAATIALAVVGVVVGIVVWAHLRFWVRRISLELAYDSIDVLETEDGAAIELRRLAHDRHVEAAHVDANGAPTPRVRDAVEDALEAAHAGTHAAHADGAQPPAGASLPPVVLVHGICANHRNQDVHPDYSLARYLSALGRDVWLVTLRSGCARTSVARRQVRFEAMAKYDIPLAIETVLARTGAPRVDYVGFSMGGMLLYAALAGPLTPRALRRCVFVGSPAVVTRWPLALRALRFLPRPIVPTLPVRFFARAFAFLAEWFSTPVHHLVMNPRNVARGVTRVALVDCMEDVPGPLAADFLTWLAGDGTVRAHGTRLADAVRSAAIPALFIAGAADRIAPPSSVKVAFDAWGAGDARGGRDVAKRFVVLGRDYGSKENYGHGDLAVGAHVGVELFPPIARFLGPDEQPQKDLETPECGDEAVRSIDGRVPLPAA
jgi:pimeloyl-ACP methyl ester carboxylesterase